MADHTDQMISIRDCRIRLMRGGNGAPLVFLHGSGGVGIWLPCMARLAQSFDVIAPEHPGFGDSDTPPWLDTIGDLANFSHQGGKPLPGVAQPAIQAGHYVGKTIERRLRGEIIKPFHYVDKGNLATIGRAAAVADLNWLRLSGWPAWMIWIFIHLLYIVQFQNRLLVLLQWAWLYITYDRSARLITGKNPLPLDL